MPEELKTSELCLAAVKNDAYSLKFVPERLKTKKMCRMTVTRHGYFLKFVPEAFRTAKLCLIAVKKDVRAIMDVPDAIMTEGLCLAALTSNGAKLHKKETGEFVLVKTYNNGGSFTPLYGELKERINRFSTVLQNNRGIRVLT
ncbi:hypothetical protein AGMMS50267_16080 [Spirochaetia bacterium]|nr:hypothetical protein AGMMS50267_16080 [Spirochaetia bacterium]